MNKNVVIDDEHNYNIELLDTRASFRRAVKKAPYHLSKEIHWHSKSMYADLRTLWGLTQDPELCNLKPIVRLRRDLQWRFSGLLGNPDNINSRTWPFHLRDYYIHTQPSTAALAKEAHDVAAYKERIKAGVSDVPMTTFASVARKTLKIRDYNLGEWKTICGLFGLNCTITTQIELPNFPTTVISDLDFFAEEYKSDPERRVRSTEPICIQLCSQTLVQTLSRHEWAWEELQLEGKRLTTTMGWLKQIVFHAALCEEPVIAALRVQLQRHYPSFFGIPECVDGSDCMSGVVHFEIVTGTGDAE